MNGQVSKTLCDVLDDDSVPNHNAAEEPNSSQELQSLLQAEHQARLEAEAKCVDHVQRLAVHAQQVSEYAQQKSTDLSEILKQAQAIQDFTGETSSKVADSLKRLFKYIEDASNDAASFADQARQDAKRHRVKPLPDGTAMAASDSKEQAGSMEEDGQTGEEMDVEESQPSPGGPDDVGGDATVASMMSTPSLMGFADQATYTPMRLSLEERRYFNLLEATLGVSDYTDKVDILSWRRRDGRVLQQVKDICSILSGLVVAQDYKAGQALVKGRDFKANAAFFRHVFEVGRRYKIMNPDRMRGTYGKLLYMLMDTASSNIEELLEFSCIQPLTTVKAYLESVGAQNVLRDPRLAIATAEIDASPGRSRAAINNDLAKKETARKQLAKTHATDKCPPDDLLNAVYSLSDYHTYLKFNRDPIEKMISYLKKYFDPRKSTDPAASLAITSGRGGARLSHNHERQYSYVHQSLILWSEIAKSMFRLWYLAEKDLLSTKNSYTLRDTGQGLNRIQAAPLVGREMSEILRRCQSMVGGWVGSSVVHLGDTNVPNALMFIDKYTQVPRILNPVAQVLDELPCLSAKDANVKAYVDAAFGSVEKCRQAICQDFFQHAFDGSGADNFFDAGSCIDGRLTSAWNWCSKVEKKDYYVVFKMCGFSGFDGDFK